MRTPAVLPLGAALLVAASLWSYRIGRPPGLRAVREVFE